MPATASIFHPIMIIAFMSLSPPSLNQPQISYLDAILGNENVDVEVVDGSVEIKVPSGCQPGTVLRIRNKGAPQLNNASVGVKVLFSAPCGGDGLGCKLAMYWSVL